MAETKILGSKTTTAISSILGGVTGFVSEYIINKFPKDYFKTKYISTSLTHNKFAKSSWDKPKYPAISVDPEMQLNQSLGSPWASYFDAYLYYHKNTRDNYLPVMIDDESEIYITSIPQRLKFQYNFKIRVRGKMAALDIVNFINRSFESENYFFVNNVGLDSEIPKTFIKIVELEKGFNLDPKDENNTIPEFLTYLTKNSRNGIVRNIDGADGNERYEFKYFTNLLFKSGGTPSLSYSNKSKDEGFTDIEFSFEVELWHPTDFLIQVGRSSYNYSEHPELQKMDTIPDNFIAASNVSLDYIDLARDKPEHMNIIQYTKFMTDNDSSVDLLDLNTFFEPLVLRILKFIKNNNINFDRYFKFNLFYGKSKLPDDSFSFDIKDLTITTYAPFANSVYHVVLLGDVDAISKLYEFMEKEDKKEITFDEKLNKM